MSMVKVKIVYSKPSGYINLLSAGAEQRHQVGVIVLTKLNSARLLGCTTLARFHKSIPIGRFDVVSSTLWTRFNFLEPILLNSLSLVFRTSLSTSYFSLGGNTSSRKASPEWP